MIIIYTKSYDNSLKKLKRYTKEKRLLLDIIDFIEHQPTFTDLVNNPLNKLYSFERLKYKNNSFYSFRLSKIIRLIVQPREGFIELELVYISKNHYVDFNKDKVIYYDE